MNEKYYKTIYSSWVCVWGEGGGGVIYIWHSMDVCAKWLPFSVLPGI